MPHLTIEYSKNLEIEMDVEKVLRDAHTSLIGCPGIEMARVKSRLHVCQHVLNQEDAHDIKMIHVTLAILSGRDDATKKTYGEKLLSSIKKNIPEKIESSTALSVEIRDMNLNSYFR